MRYFSFHTLNILILIILLSLSCGEEKPPEVTIPEKVLVKIRDKTITVDEFIRRAEYTVRPPYCNTDLPLHKKIVLNSLIAEKLFALEAGEDNEFLNSEDVETYLLGRKEQAMRQWQYFQEAHQKVELDTQLLANTVHLMGRKYNINYVSIDDYTKAQEFKAKLDAGDKSFEEICLVDYQLEAIPEREVSWGKQETDAILDLFYTKPLEKDAVIGPVQFQKDHYMYFKINGWINQPAITNQQIERRVNDITDYYTGRIAKRHYETYIREIMSGKEIRFLRDNLFALADLLGPIYLRTASEKNEIVKENYWNLQNESDIDWSNASDQLTTLFPEPLFQIDGDVWTVERFWQATRQHPLVFRKNKMKNQEFGAQLQLAIIDLIRDQHLTQAAYESGYDQKAIVKSNNNMWKDNINALNHKFELLQTLGVDSLYRKNYIPVIEEYLNSYVDNLQKKYSNDIEIDTDAFDEITLTKTPMVVTQPQAPFAIVVPAFPIITTDHQLDYGRKTN